MKIRKLLAILCAAMLGCCAFGGTAFAEGTEPVDYSQYQLGDITMDGVVDVEDAQLALQCFTEALAHQPFKYIPYEQQLLVCARGFTIKTHWVYPQENSSFDITYIIDIEDVQSILNYYSDSLSNKTTLSYEEWIKADQRMQDYYAALYESVVTDPEHIWYSDQTDPETGERTVLWYNSSTVQKVRE